MRTSFVYTNQECFREDGIWQRAAKLSDETGCENGALCDQQQSADADQDQRHADQLASARGFA
jgi:hypothetical protein